mmetsp:Transcript_13318/g.46488  ORF Transcript_13318/g.46488 Transcript_13318/m.46488 type:complete len:127 (-) Transcript_13318:370-750(-)
MPSFTPARRRPYTSDPRSCAGQRSVDSDRSRADLFNFKSTTPRLIVDDVDRGEQEQLSKNKLRRRPARDALNREVAGGKRFVFRRRSQTERVDLSLSSNPNAQTEAYSSMDPKKFFKHVQKDITTT